MPTLSYLIVLTATDAGETYSSGPAPSLQDACVALLTQLANSSIEFDSDVLNALGVVIDKAMYDDEYEPYSHSDMGVPENDFTLKVHKY